MQFRVGFRVEGTGLLVLLMQTSKQADELLTKCLQIHVAPSFDDALCDVFVKQSCAPLQTPTSTEAPLFKACLKHN